MIEREVGRKRWWEGKTMSDRQTDLLILLWVHIVWLQELIEIHIMWLERERVRWEEGERTKGWREKEVEKLSHTHTKTKQSV